jgi:GT2 family glycosyltransferase
VCAYSEIVYPLPSAASLKTAWMTGTLPGAMQIDPSSPEVIVEYPRGAPILVWRRFLSGMRYFDERFGDHWADLELCWQLRSAGKKVVMLPHVRVSYLREAAVTTDYVDRADSAIGAAAYLGKHYGMPSGLGFRLSAVVHALTRLDFKLLGALVSGQKIDGTQA